VPGGAGSSAGSVGAAGSSSAGAPGAAGGGSACPGVTTGATFLQVETIFAKSCGTSTCHPSSKDGSHIDLHNKDGKLHERLLGTATNTKAECQNHTIVVPCKPDESFLMAMVGTDDAARLKCGARMPDECTKPGNMCLSDADMETLRSWIAVGAPE
jgi:hypothetical protein